MNALTEAELKSLAMARHGRLALTGEQIATVARIVAAREVRAERQALLEAASEWASEYDRLTRDHPRQTKSRAAYRMASQLAEQRALPPHAQEES